MSKSYVEKSSAVLNRASLRVRPWFDTATCNEVQVIEARVDGKWRGLMIEGRPLTFPDHATATSAMKKLINEAK